MKLLSKTRHMMAALLAAIVVVGGAIAPAVANDRYIPGPRGMTGAQGPKGNPGAGMLSGPGAPTNDVGANGDFYVDTANFRIYGPKAGGVWGPGSISLGIAAASPIAGVNGGTGVSNDGRTITLGGNITTAGALTLAGAYSATFTLAGNTSISFPVTGTLLTTTGDGSGLTALNAGNIASGTLAVARGGTGVTTATGTGSVVRADSPTHTGVVSFNGSGITSGVRVGADNASYGQLYWRGNNNLGVIGGTGAATTLSVASDENGTNNRRLTLQATSTGANIFSDWSSGGIPFSFGAGTTQWQVNTSGNLLAFSDNSYDIGASGASRPRNVFLANNLTANAVQVASRVEGVNATRIGLSSDGVAVFSNQAVTDFNKIVLGPANDSFPALVRSGAELQVLLGGQAAGGTTAGLRARYLRTPSNTLANCGTANGTGSGALCYVSNLTSTNVGDVATSGGSLSAFVFSDGADWRVLGAGAPQGLRLVGASSGSVLLQPNGAATGTITVPNGTDVLVARNTTDTLTNKTLASNTVATTQSAADNSTKVATTAYVDNAVSASGAVPTGTIMPFAGFTAPGGYFFANGQAVSRTTYAALFNTLTASSTVTITIASPAVVTWTAHGFIPGMPIVLTSTGALATGLTAGTTYYVVNVTTNTFELSTTVNGSSINTSGSQSGTHTARAFPFGVGDGSTTFNVPDFRGRAPFGVDNMGGVAAASRLGANASVGGITYNAILGTAGGAQTHVQTVAELAPHTHAVPGGMVGGADVSGAGGPYLSAGFTNNGTSGSTGTASPMNITPPALVVNYIIRQRRRPANDNRRGVVRPRQILRRAA